MNLAPSPKDRIAAADRAAESPDRGRGARARLGRQPGQDDYREYNLAPDETRGLTATLYVMLALLLSAFAWIALARLDIVVTGEGKISTEEQLAVVQPFEMSVIRDIKVKVGDKVRKDQVLAELDPTNVSADAEDAASQRDAAQAKLARAEAEFKGVDYNPPHPSKAERIERDVFIKRHEEVVAHQTQTAKKVSDLEAQLATKREQEPHLKRDLAAAEEEAALYTELQRDGNGSKVKMLDALRSVADSKGKLIDNLGAQKSLAEQIQAARADYDSFFKERMRQLSEDATSTRKDLETALSQLAKAELRNALITMRAPIDGVVLNVAQRASGSVVREAETLVTLVPTNAEMGAEIEVETRDIARLQVGDKATIKLEALPYQQFGFIDGEVKTITPDALTSQESSDLGDAAGSGSGDGKPPAPAEHSYYSVRIRITQNRMRNLPPSFMLRPGMKVTVDITVGERPVYEYILNPLVRVMHESMREP